MSLSTWQEHSKIQNVGLGFRACHYSYIIENLPSVPWFEIVTENYLGKQGFALEQLLTLRQHYPITFHGVSMSLGSSDELNFAYLQQLKQLIELVNPAYISDHLCWTSVNGEYFHELLPLPYTEDTINYVSTRIQQVQDFLGQQIVIENVSSYLRYANSHIEEWDFINTIAEKADCFILLDINNIYVSAHNHGFDPVLYLNKINSKRVKQFHLAGFLDCKTHLLDNHGAQVHRDVWSLYEIALKRFGPIPTLIEWDNEIPDFVELQNEAVKAQKFMDGLRLVDSPASPFGLRRGRPFIIKPAGLPRPSPKGEAGKMQESKILQQQVASFLKKQKATDQNIIHAPNNISAQESIEIYRDSFNSAFLNVLIDTFPVCKKIVGDEFFKNMAKCYIEQQASYSTNIDHYGKFFPEFIRNFAHTQTLPYLGDTAELEWLLQCVAEGENYSTIDINTLQKIEETQHSNIIFQRAKNSFLVSSAYPINMIWEFNQDYYKGPEQLELNHEACFLIIWRPQNLPQFETITHHQWLLLQQLQNNLSIENLCKHFAAIDSFDIETNLSFCISKGWINNFIF